jgi:hypothetical protein
LNKVNAKSADGSIGFQQTSCSFMLQIEKSEEDIEESKKA